MITTIRLKIIFLLSFLYFSAFIFAQKQLQTPGIHSVLYTGKGKKQPLIVGLGGSEGGNAWASERWKVTREEFVQQGYAFLAIGYFSAPGTPDTLDRISLEVVHDAILVAAKDAAIDADKIAIVGGSRGGDLALLLASRYKHIDCVVALVPSHVVFPGHTMHFSTSCWTWKEKQLPFVPVNEAAVPYLIKGDLRKAFETMLSDTVAEQKALIPVERIQAPVLLISATNDEIAPTEAMCEKIMQCFKQHHFKYATRHIVIEGKHTSVLQHFDLVFDFLKLHFSVE